MAPSGRLSVAVLPFLFSISSAASPSLLPAPLPPTLHPRGSRMSRLPQLQQRLILAVKEKRYPNALDLAQRSEPTHASLPPP